LTETIKENYPLTSVGDPNPDVFELPGSGIVSPRYEQIEITLAK
jgi:hypothetical protein